MALIVEDGSIVDGATSYITVEVARAYASARGSALPDDDAAVEALIMQAMDYVESFRSRYSGKKVSADQPLQWPRSGATLDGYAIADDMIPRTLIAAQAQSVIDASITDLMPTDTRTAKKSVKVDVIEVEYAISADGDGSIQPELTKVDALLEPLFRSGLGGAILSSVRV